MAFRFTLWDVRSCEVEHLTSHAIMSPYPLPLFYIPGLIQCCKQSFADGVNVGEGMNMIQSSYNGQELHVSARWFFTAVKTRSAKEEKKKKKKILHKCFCSWAPKWIKLQRQLHWNWITRWTQVEPVLNSYRRLNESWHTSGNVF